MFFESGDHFISPTDLLNPLVRFFNLPFALSYKTKYDCADSCPGTSIEVKAIYFPSGEYTGWLSFPLLSEIFFAGAFSSFLISATLTT